MRIDPDFRTIDPIQSFEFEWDMQTRYIKNTTQDFYRAQQLYNQALQMIDEYIATEYVEPEEIISDSYQLQYIKCELQRMGLEIKITYKVWSDGKLYKIGFYIDLVRPERRHIV